MEKTKPKIVVIGNSFGGIKTVRALQAAFKGNSAEITVIERAANIYCNIGSPRAFCDQVYAEKIFISQAAVFKSEEEGKIVQGTVASFTDKTVTLEDATVIEFDYLVIASGMSYLPYNIADISKDAGLATLATSTEKIKKASKITFIGGGPVGIETAAEIREYFPDKEVTIVHSGATLLHNFKISDSTKARLLKKVTSKGIKVIFGEKAILPEGSAGLIEGSHEIKTEKGTVIASDLTFCTTGHAIPRTEFVGASLLNEKKFIKVKDTLQVDDSSFSSVFAVGDVAASGAPKIGLVIDAQASIIAGNIVALVNKKAMKAYKPAVANLIFVSLGKTDGFGTIPWMPAFATDYLCKSLKSKNLFVDVLAGAYNVKIQ